MIREDKIRAFFFIWKAIEEKDWNLLKNHLKHLEEGLGLDSETLRRRYWEKKFHYAGKHNYGFVAIKNQEGDYVAFKTKREALTSCKKINKRLKAYYRQ